MLIQELIDKQDNFEVIRDQIALILANETVSQQALAVTAGKPDPTLWKLRVYTERSHPWETFLNDQTDRSPIVNVWVENSGFDMSKGNVVKRQASSTIFNIDCYGYGTASDDPGGGHNPGDKEAAFTCHRAVRLVRNILMSANYVYLDLRGTVGRRWPQNITIFQPEQGGQAIQNIVAGRVALNVEFNEFSPQIQGEELETVSVTIKRAEDGQVIAEAEFDYS